MRSSVSLPTVPARVTLWFLEPPGDVSEGNPSEDVHVAAEPKTNVLALHHPPLCVHDPELHKLNLNKCLNETITNH